MDAGWARFVARTWLFVAFSLTILHGADAGAQEVAETARPDSSYRPRIAITRIDPSAAPEIDGIISEEEWAGAARIDEFYQVFPQEGATPSEETHVYLLYDETTLYVGIYAFDRTPEEITASVMNRDGEVGKDDVVSILIDSFDTGRDAFLFEMNPVGARREALIENNQNFKDKWNTIWRGRAQIHDDGWAAEFAIPFQSFSHNVQADDWGFQILRRIARRNESIRWAVINQSYDGIDMTRAGRLAGIENVSPGMGLDIETFGTANWIRNWQPPLKEDDFTFDVSGNVFYKFTPSLTGTLTVNTDFSDSPLDARQVNTGRFSLFFPETRDFFLQDAALFEFGGRPLNNSVNGIPFFTRRLGIVNGEPVGIKLGGKVSGSYDRFTIGALTTLTGGGDSDAPQILSALRVSAQVLEQSKAGFIITHGDPAGETMNTVVGGDFQYQTSSFLGDQRFAFDSYFLRSISDETGQSGNNFGFEAALPNDKWNAFFRFKQVDEDFTPSLGFVNRPGVRSYNGNVRYRNRPQDSYFRFVEVGSWYEFVTDLDNFLESRTNGLWFGGGNQPGDVAFVNLWNSEENIREPFFLPNDVLVPADDYMWSRGSIYLESSNSRPISFRFEIGCCDWFDGTRTDLDMGVEFRPNRWINLGINHNIFLIGLPTGDVTIHINSATLNINFSPDMQFTSEAQYDNISQSLTYLGRLFWEIRPETELFVALSHGERTNFNTFESIQSGISVRVGNTLRY